MPSPSSAVSVETPVIYNYLSYLILFNASSLSYIIFDNNGGLV